MSRIGAAFAAARGAGRAAFIPYITAGDPTPRHTADLCAALAAAGADVIELGVPWSDPLADGPTIQRACRRALEQGVGLARSLELAAETRARVPVALVLFTYYNPILQMGEEAFAERAARAGLDGVLVTDLPMEEGGGLRHALQARGIDPILLLAPTSGAARVAAAAAHARGFLYYICRTGVTGEREALPEGLAGELAALRRAAAAPVAVGFGISRPDQVLEAGRLADGVVVGSALVAEIERSRQGPLEPPADLAARIGRAASLLLGGSRGGAP